MNSISSFQASFLPVTSFYPHHSHLRLGTTGDFAPGPLDHRLSGEKNRGALGQGHSDCIWKRRLNFRTPGWFLNALGTHPGCLALRRMAVIYGTRTTGKYHAKGFTCVMFLSPTTAIQEDSLIILSLQRRKIKHRMRGVKSHR